MAARSYDTDSLTWRIRQSLQRFQEWMEYQLTQADVDFPDRPHWLWLEAVGKGLFWLLMAALVVWCSWLIYRLLERPLQRWLERKQLWVLPGDGGESLAETHTPQYWWRQAQVQAQQGNYREACLALYRATLQHLHDTQTLLHDPSRTDGEYLQDLESHLGNRSSSRPYQLLIHTHERLTFGRDIASAEIFQRCRRAYQEIQKT